MNRMPMILMLWLATACGSAPPPHGPISGPEADRGAGEAAASFVVIHGAWGGGWAWGPVDALLTEAGHVVHRPTLTGLGDRVHLARPETDLDTHITDIVHHLIFERLEDVVLVGHSYGGMVAAGVADRVPERIRRLVLIDAFLPEDGESVLTATAGTRLERFIADAVAGAADGAIVPSWLGPDEPWPTDVPQPLRTFTEPIALRNPAAARLPGTYILTVEPRSDPADDHYAPFAARAEARGWEVVVLRSDHNPQNSAREALAALLRAVVEAGAGVGGT